MTVWNELNAAERPSGLAEATLRQVAPGVFRYAFVHDDYEVDNPTLDVTGSQFVSPREYRFAIRGFHGGKTAWARDFANGTMLVANPDGQSHVLSAKGAARILFIARDGTVLQDTAQGPSTAPQRDQQAPVTVRLSINVSVALNGEAPDAVRARLMRSLDDALQSDALLAGTEARVVDHQIEHGAVLSDARGRSSETDFSQLLDL